MGQQVRLILLLKRIIAVFSDLAQMGPDGTSEGVRDLRS